MIKLTLRYFRLYERAPKAHQKHRSGQGHRCLHQEWEAAFRTLATLLEEAEEPRLFRQPKAAPVPPSRTGRGATAQEDGRGSADGGEGG